MVSTHVPVLLEKALECLITIPDGIYVDGTLGTGGHFQALSKKLAQNAILIGIDTDPTAIDFCKNHLAITQKHLFINANFYEIKKVCYRAGYTSIHGVILDLGLSSFALDNPERGFSFSSDGPLDMRFSPTLSITAENFINQSSPSDLAKIFKNYSEERYSQVIAHHIFQARQKAPIRTTAQLTDIIRTVVPLHFQTKTLSRIFQAIRIHINSELEILKQTLQDCLDLLVSKGRLVVISYHSLEDRIVKEFMKYEASDCICPVDFPTCQCHHKAQLELLTKKPITPQPDEIQNNSRARSAKLRAAAKQ
jgi:16S rRNA (cytosine1402-N4)-methyltransferase